MKLGKAHPFVGRALAGHGLCLDDLGKHAQAVPILEQARQIGEASADRELVERIDRALQKKRAL